MAKSKTSSELLPIVVNRLSLATKFGKDYKTLVDRWVKDYNIETMDNAGLDSMSNKVQIPYIFSTIESGLPLMFEQVPYLIMKQRGKEDIDFSDFTNSVWEYVQDKVKLEERVEEVGIMFKVSGMGAAKYGWRTETETVEQEREVELKDEEGNVIGTEVVIDKVEVPVVDQPFVQPLSYKNVYYSPESKFEVDDEENKIPYIICHSVMTPEEIKEKFGKMPSDTGFMNVADLESEGREYKMDDQAPEVQADMRRGDVYEYYGVLPKNSVTGDWKSNYVYYMAFTKGEVLKDAERIQKKPVVQIDNFGLPTKFHKFGDPKVLRELEQDISLGRSRLMDLRDKWGTKIALPQGTEVDERRLKNPADFVILRYAGQQLPSYITPPPPPETLLVALGQSKEDIQLASAQLDISRGGSSSVVETATGQKIFQQATEKRIARQRKKIGRFIRALAKNLLVLCANKWDVETFAKITDLTVEEITQNQYLERLKSLGDEWDIDIEVDSVTNNKEVQASQAIAMYREMKEDPLVNREEILKEVLKVGFSVKNLERFLSKNVSPEQVLATLEYLVQNQIIPEEMAQQMVLGLRQLLNPEGEAGAGGQVGRPAKADPTAIVKKSMAGADQTQMAAQGAAAYKQTGVDKGPQNVG